MQKSKNIRKIKNILRGLLFMSLFLPFLAYAQYDPTFLLSDEVLRDYNSMSEADINNFLRSKGSWLADYIIPQNVSVAYPYLQPDGSVTIGYVDAFQGYNGKNFFGKTVARLIFEEAQEHRINPRVILVLLQRESSAITRNAPSSKLTETWPLFYYFNEAMASCLAGDTSKCNNDLYRQRAIDFGGVGQQIAYATYWLEVRFQSYSTNKNYLTPLSIDGQLFSIRNAATYLLYIYTPHLSANKNFYDIFVSWFCDPTGTQCLSNSPAPPASPPPDAPNDLLKFSSKTYKDTLVLRGSKSVNVRVFLGDTLIADLGSNAWEITLRPQIGTTNQSLLYKDANGNVVGSKPIEVERHKIADINGDGRVDLLDLSILANFFGVSNPPDPLVNLNPEVDNEVNILDLSILAANWSG
jgi:uncharacterized membrane protein